MGPWIWVPDYPVGDHLDGVDRLYERQFRWRIWDIDRQHRIHGKRNDARMPVNMIDVQGNDVGSMFRRIIGRYIDAVPLRHDNSMLQRNISRHPGMLCGSTVISLSFS